MTTPLYGILTSRGWLVPDLPPAIPNPTDELEPPELSRLIEQSGPSVWDTDALEAEVLDALEHDE